MVRSYKSNNDFIFVNYFDMSSRWFRNFSLRRRLPSLYVGHGASTIVCQVGMRAPAPWSSVVPPHSLDVRSRYVDGRATWNVSISRSLAGFCARSSAHAPYVTIDLARGAVSDVGRRVDSTPCLRSPLSTSPSSPTLHYIAVVLAPALLTLQS